MIQDSKRNGIWHVFASTLVITLVSGCATSGNGVDPMIAPPETVAEQPAETLVVDTLQTTPQVDVDIYEGTSAEDFPPEVLTEEFSAAGDTVFVDEYVSGDTTHIDAFGSEMIFGRAWERQQAAQGLIRLARAQLDTALALLDTIPKQDTDSSTLAIRDEIVFELSRFVRRLATAEEANGRSHDGEIPLELNSFVEKEIKSFQGRERRWFLAAYARAGSYLERMKKKFRDAGMPEQIVWLAFIESGFKTNAFSRARALGPWQFIASTGNRYGLKRDRWTDSRRDFDDATDAAIAYLTDLHGMFGDWNTALAAYNSGEGRVARALNRQSADHLDQFWDLYVQLPQETRRYVPRFHAVLNIIGDPERWGFTDLPTFNDPVQFDTVVVRKQMALKDISQRLGIGESELEFLNPSLRHKITPEYSYTLRVPPGMSQRCADLISGIPTSDLPDVPEFVIHRIRYGETLSTIARKYRSSVRSIMAANNIRSAHRIRAGQRLRVPVRNTRYTASRSRNAGGAVVIPEGAVVHVVRRGDTLGAIAETYNTRASRIRRLNDMGRSSTIYPGQKLVVKVN
jgi:membrane-bound lytic murein transglycosylase D